MMKQTRVFLHMLLLALCLTALAVAAACETVEPAVPEAIITEPEPNVAPEAQVLNLSLALPAEAKTGDLLIAQICYYGSAKTTVTPPTSDWAAILMSDSQGELYAVSFYKMLDRESEHESEYEFALLGESEDSTQISAAGKIMWFRGIDPDNPIYVNDQMTGNGTSLTAGKMDAGSSCRVVALFSIADNESGLTLPANRQDIRALYNESMRGGFVLCAAEGIQPGAAGDLTAEANQGGAWISQVIALRYAQMKIVFASGQHGTLTRERLDDVTVSARGSLAASDIPSVNADNGYAFTGWLISSGVARLDAAGVCKLDLSEGMKLTAQYQRKIYTVKFDLGENGKSNDTLVFTNLHYGDTIKIPAVSVRIGWTFAGWDKTPSTKVVGNATYTAKYTQNVYAVTFDLGEHGASEDQLIFTGLHDLDTIVIPDVTSDSGWSFDGWDTTPETTVIGNANYTAQYSETETTYTVTFALGEHGTSEDTLIFSDLEDGDTITVPNVTPYEGWEFSGWDAEPETTVYGSVTYYATYTAIPYTVIFDLGEHGHSDDQLVFENMHYGDTITIPSFSLDKGYMLIGWNIPPSTTVTEDACYTLIYHAPATK